MNKAEMRALIAATVTPEVMEKHRTRYIAHKARGLYKDVGNMGKGSRVRHTRTFGNGFRHGAAITWDTVHNPKTWELYSRA